MKNRLFAIITVVLLSAVLLTSCTHIEDTNGADTALCTLTEEDILASTNSSTRIGSVSSQVNNKYSLKVKKLSGVFDYTSLNLQAGQLLVIESDVVVESGNLRIVIVCDGEYVADISVGTDQHIEVKIDRTDKYEIRIAGESANFTFQFTYTVE
ncbi:MAG: hypothetical protein IJY39_00325 [Clostridia bacterium]|nr:hypothetical protein [Clostridia bacterium]